MSAAVDSSVLCGVLLQDPAFSPPAKLALTAAAQAGLEQAPQACHQDRDAAWLLTQFYCDKKSGVSLALQSAPGPQTTGGGRPDVYSDPRLLNHPSAPRSVQGAESASNRTTEPYALPANHRADEISSAVNPFIDRITRNEAQPTPSFM